MNPPPISVHRHALVPCLALMVITIIGGSIPVGGQTISQWIVSLHEATEQPALPPPSISDPFTRISQGGNFAIGLRANGTVAAWGDNRLGQCSVPGDITTAVAIAAGGDHSLALLANGRVRAWGGNGRGQLNVPAGLSNVVAVSAGYEYSMALRSNGTVAVWGSDPQYKLNPTPAGLNQVKAISAGAFHALAVKQNGSVITWGTGQFPYFTNKLAVPSSVSNIVAVAAGVEHSLALTAEGRVVGWGEFAYGITNIPLTATNVVEIALGSAVAVARRADGKIVAWGSLNHALTDFGFVQQISAQGYSILGLLNQPTTRRIRAAVPQDFDGDLRTDLVVFHPPSATWYIRKSSDDQFLQGAPFNWGPGNAIPVCGDYDGDGKTDLGLCDPVTFTWYIRLSTTGQLLNGGPIQFGPGDSVPVPHDYDGDGRTDIAVHQTSTGKWYVRKTSNGQLLGGGSISIGLLNQVPVLGDFDGDFKSDFGLWSQSAKRSEVFLSTHRRQVSYWGLGADSTKPISQAPVMGDFNGDGVSDFSSYVYRFSVARAYAPVSLPAGVWGGLYLTLLAGDKVGSTRSWPVPGDYDGDTITDAAAFNYLTRKWTIRFSSTGQRSSFIWPPQRTKGLIHVDNQLMVNRLTGAQP